MSVNPAGSPQPVENTQYTNNIQQNNQTQEDFLIQYQNNDQTDIKLNSSEVLSALQYAQQESNPNLENDCAKRVSFKDFFSNIFGGNKDAQSEAPSLQGVFQNQTPYQIDLTHQVGGTCATYSAINALSYTKMGAEIIENSIEYKNDGSGIKVHIKGLSDDDKQDGDAFVSIPYETFKEKENMLPEDIDMSALILAYEGVARNVQQGNLIPCENAPDYIYSAAQYNNAADDSLLVGYGTESAQLLYLLTGKESQTIMLGDNNEESKNEFTQLLREFSQSQAPNGRGNIVLSANSSKGNQMIKDADGKDVYIQAPHMYAVKNAGSDGNKACVWLVDPYDSSKTIKLDNDTFYNTFSSICKTDLSGEDKKFLEQGYCDPIDSSNPDSPKKTIKNKQGQISSVITYDSSGTQPKKIESYTRVSGEMKPKATSEFLSDGTQLRSTSYQYRNTGSVQINSEEYYTDKDVSLQTVYGSLDSAITDGCDYKLPEAEDCRVLQISEKKLYDNNNSLIHETKTIYSQGNGSVPVATKFNIRYNADGTIKEKNVTVGQVISIQDVKNTRQEV